MNIRRLILPHSIPHFFDSLYIRHLVEYSIWSHHYEIQIISYLELFNLGIAYQDLWIATKLLYLCL